MLGLRRCNFLRLKHMRSLTMAATSQTSTGPSPTRVRKDNSSHGVRKVIHVLPAEQLQLQNKHRDTLESNRALTLREIVEHIEWRGVVYSETPEKIAKLLGDPREDLSLLSDRQLCVLLSSFGQACESVGNLRKSVLLNQAVQALRKRDVVLGPLARNALLSSRVDIGEQVNAIDELNSWEADGLSPNGETYGLLSKVYANVANTQAIVDIINHMKANNMSVSESILESLVYSVAKGGHYNQAEALVEKFLLTANEVALRTAIARAAVSRSDTSFAVNALASIPSRAKLNQISNNKYVLEVLFDMLEAGDITTIDKVKPYLVLDHDGPFLVEWHANSKVLARARRACSEGKLKVAMQLYGLLHPKFKNSNFESSLLEALGGCLNSKNYPLSDIVELASMMQSYGLLQDPELFLLERSVNTTRAYDILLTIKDRDSLERCLANKPLLRKGLARRLSEQLTSSKMKKESRVALLADLAMVLFSYDSERKPQDVMLLYPIIYVLGGKDVDYAIPALDAVQSEHVRKEYATALLQQLLRKGDPLAKEKLEKLLDSGAVHSVFINRIHKQIMGLVINRDKKEGAADERQLSLAARLIALSFPPENAKMKTDQAANYVVSQLQSELLSTSRARFLISCLEKEPRVRFSSDDIAAGKKVLMGKGQKEKAEMLERLRRRNQVYARWLESSIDSLEEEMAHIMSNPDHKPAVVYAIQEVILKKIASEEPINFARVDRHLRQIAEFKTGSSTRVSDLASNMFSIALSAALSERNFEVAQALWEHRPSLPSVESTLAFVSLLVLHERLELADSVCEDLRASAQTITASVLQTVGDHLGDQWSMEDMRKLTKYLQEKFNLGTQQLLRLVACVRLRQLENLIDAGKLEEALQLVVEHTVESNAAFGQYQLAAAAIKAENMGVLKSVFDVVKRAHGKEVAFLDLALVLLEEGHTERALKLLETPHLKISQGKLDFFIKRAVDNNRPDVLRGLFTGLCQQDRASTVALNRLLVQLSRMYYKANELVQLDSLEAEIDRVSFPLEKEMRTVFKNLRRQKTETKDEAEAEASVL